MSKYLINTARTLIFSTALSPPAVAAAMAALELLRGAAAPGREAAAQRARAARGAGRVRPAGRPRRDADRAADRRGRGRAAMAASERALERGVFAQAIRPPTVPAGTSRLRLAVMASHTKSELREAGRVLAAAIPRRDGRVADAARRVRRVCRRRVGPCAGSSSRARTPAWGSPWWRPRCAPRWSSAAMRWRPSSRSSPGSTSHRASGRRTTSCWRGRPAGPGAGAGGPVPVRPAAVAALRRRAGRGDDRAGAPGRGRARRRRRPADRRGRRRPARADHARLPGARPGDRAELPRGDRGAHRPRNDQPHAADGRGRPRCRPDASPGW